jgi:hypothetical protein
MTAEQAPNTNQAASVTSSLKWPLDLSWVCLAAPIAIALVLATLNTQQDSSGSFDAFQTASESVLTPVALLLKAALEAPLFIATWALGRRALTGSRLITWGLTGMWVAVAGLFALSQPVTAICFAPALLGWLYVALKATLANP